MKKILIITAVTMVILGISSGVLAFENGSGFGAGRHDQCLLEALDDGQKTQFEEIISEYREKMSALRESIYELRESGSYDEFREAHENRHTLMEEKRDALRDVIPEKYAEVFEGRGQGMRHHGWHNGSGGFKSRDTGENGT